jgi:hypothetical protein
MGLELHVITGCVVVMAAASVLSLRVEWLEWRRLLKNRRDSKRIHERWLKDQADKSEKEELEKQLEAAKQRIEDDL